MTTVNDQSIRDELLRLWQTVRSRAVEDVCGQWHLQVSREDMPRLEELLASVTGATKEDTSIDFSTWIPHVRKTWTHRFARLKRDVEFSVYQGRWEGDKPVTTERLVRAGTWVKITMVSRFGDCGITDDLADDQGYHARVKFDDLTEFSKTAYGIARGT